MSRYVRPGLLVTAASVVALTLGGGVAQALPLDGDGGSPLDGIPLIGDGSPKACSITSSDPYRKQTCNQDGGNGRDGEDGSVRGDRSDRHAHSRHDDADDRQYDVEADELGPDINGAPGRSGAPRAVVAPGSAPHPF